MSASALAFLMVDDVRAQQAATTNQSPLPPITVERPTTRAPKQRRAAAPQPAAPAEQAPAQSQSAGTDGVTTEGTDSYTTDMVTLGKGAENVRSIPQSVSVVTNQRIQDQNMTTLEDAARRTTGLIVLQNDKGRSSIFSRGFEFDTFNIDGLPAPLSSIYGTQPDLAPFDRVEILRGPAGLFAGTGEPAGTLNLARKRANKTFGASAEGTVGSWQNYRGEGDVNIPLTADGSVRARFVGAWQDANNFVNVNTNGVQVAYGTLEIDLAPRTTLSLVALHQERDITPFNGLPAYANGRLASVDRSTFSGASWNRFNNRTDDYIAELEHKFDGGGQAKAAVRYSNRDADFKYSYGGGAIQPNGNYTRTTLDRDYWEKSLSWDAHVSKPFQAFGQTHNILIGTDHREYDQRVFGTGQNALPGIANNIFNANPFVPEPYVPFATRQQDTPKQTGTYGQVRIKPVAPLTLIAGGRVSWYEIDSTNLNSGVTTHAETNGKFTPYAGVVLDLTTNISAYGVFTEIFQPQPGATSVGGTILPPREGSQYEAGLKGQFLNGALNASVGYFVTRDVNRAIGDPSNPTFQIAAGKAEVQGIEAEISGKLAPGWQIFTGYAYTMSQYLESYKTYNAANGAVTGVYLAGQTFSTWTPKHNFNLWTKYEFQNPQLMGWHIAGGVRVLSSFFTRNGDDTVRWTEDGYVVADFQVGYKINKNLEATFTVNNIFDEVYYTRLGNQTTFNFYGDPRSYWLKLIAKL